MKFRLPFKNLLSGSVMAIASFASIGKHKRLLLVALLPSLLAGIAAFSYFFLIMKYSFFSNLQLYPIVSMSFDAASAFLGLLIIHLVYASMITYFFFHNHSSMTWRTALYQCFTKKIKVISLWAAITIIVVAGLSKIGTLIGETTYVRYLLSGAARGWWLLTFLMIPRLVGTKKTTIIKGFAWIGSIFFKNLLTITGAITTFFLVKEIISRFFNVVAKAIPHWLTYYSLAPSNIAALILLSMSTMFVASSLSSIIVTVAEAALAAGIYAKFIGKPMRQMKQLHWGHLVFIALLVLTIFLLIALSAASVLE